MLVAELANELLPLGTELLLVHSDNPKLKTPRPRTVIGKRGDKLYLERKDGKRTYSRWPADLNLVMTDRGFEFWKGGRKYVAYEFVHQVGDDFD